MVPPPTSLPTHEALNTAMAWSQPTFPDVLSNNIPSSSWAPQSQLLEAHPVVSEPYAFMLTVLSAQKTFLATFPVEIIPILRIVQYSLTKNSLTQPLSHYCMAENNLIPPTIPTPFGCSFFHTLQIIPWLEFSTNILVSPSNSLMG